MTVLVDYLADPWALWRHLAAFAADTAGSSWPWAAPTTAALAAGAALGRPRWHRSRQQRLTAGGTSLDILAPPQVKPVGGEMLWSNLTGLMRPWATRLTRGQPHLGFEYAWNPSGMTIRLWIPPVVPVAVVQRAVEAAWPGAHTRPGPAESLLGTNETWAAGGLRLARPEALPLRTDHDADPLRALLHAATGLPEGASAAVQILARPATGGRLRRAKNAARRLKAGRGPSRATALLDLLTRTPQSTVPRTTDPAHNAEVRQTVEKLAGPQWETAIRYLAAVPAKSPTGRDDPTHAARGRAHALASAFAVHSGRNWLARARLRHPAEMLNRRWFPLRGDLLSVPELGALAHVPTDADAPGLARAGAASVLPPPAILLPGPQVKPLGTADAGTHRPVGLAVADARHHLHIMGATGSGKSTLLAQLVLADAAAGRGAVVIDPKGDLVTDLLARLPASCADRLVVIDPDDPHHPPCLNVLDGDDIDVVVDNVTGIFRRIFAAFWGPRTDGVMRAACLTLLTHAHRTGQTVTLADIPRLLGEPAYRLRLTPQLKDPVLRGFWHWYEQMSEPTRSAVIGPVMNKLRAFLLRSFARNTIAAGASSFDLADILDGGILLARLPKGALGEETARLLGSFVVAKTWQAAAARTRTPEHQRRDACLLVDEAHNFLTLPYPLEDMLAEARGYRMSMVLAHQHLAQLPRDLREGISANARNKIIFNASPEDAGLLERHTAPTLAAHDLAHLAAYTAATRLLVDGAEHSAFTLTTRPLPPPTPGRAAALRNTAHSNHTHPTGRTRPLAPETPR